MPRPTRIEYDNAFYHVMNRGKGRQDIFHGDEYYNAFLDTLRESTRRFDAVIHAYCLMNNHYHLLIETPLANLGRIMRHINGVYTQRYNRLKKTDGPLFRGRYKAILVDEDAYLLQLSRYIHRNPIETKRNKLSSLEEFPWSSYLAYIGKVPAADWLYRDKIYQMLGHRHRFAGYRAYVESGIDEDIKRYYSKGNISAILGGREFRDSVRQEHEEIDKDVLYQALRIKPTVEQIVAAVSRVLKTTENEILERRRGRMARNDARKLSMYCCQQIGDIPLKEIADSFGLSHGGSVSRSIHDMKIKLESNELMKEYKKVESLLGVIKDA